LRDLIVGVVGREDDDARTRVALADPTDHFDALHHRHPQVEQRDVRLVALVGIDRLDAVSGFRHDARSGSWLMMLATPVGSSA
jgi:hypothetical protein